MRSGEQSVSRHCSHAWISAGTSETICDVNHRSSALAFDKLVPFRSRFLFQS